MTRTLVDFLGYLACWWAAILGAAGGLPWAGPAVAAAYLVLHLGFLDRTPRARCRVRAAFLAGILVEEANLLLGVTSYADSPLGGWLAPPWMLGLWAAYAATAGISLSWLRGRLPLAAALGAVGGPLSYLAGERLGALHVGGPGALAALAVEWAAATAWLVRAPAAPTAPTAPPGAGGPG